MAELSMGELEDLEFWGPKKPPPYEPPVKQNLTEIPPPSTIWNNPGHMGLPENHYRTLPRFVTIENIEYTPSIVWRKIFKFYEMQGNNYIATLAGYLADEFESDFYSRLENTTDKDKFIKAELKKHDFTYNAAIEYNDKIIDIQNGFKMAIEGRNPSMTSLFALPHWGLGSNPDYEILKYYPNKAYQMYKDDYERIEYQLNEVSRNVLGYAHAVFIKRVKDYLHQQKTSKSTNKNEIEFDIKFDSHAQTIAWLKELGVIDLILEKYCKTNGADNHRLAAKILNSFTGIHVDTLRKCIAEIGKGTNNDPLKNVTTRTHIEHLKAKLDIQ